MVYQGPSRGCVSCKRRRKKCDETRPYCLRCTKGDRVCGGYESNPESIFRQHEAFGDPGTWPKSSIARKCSLPKRVQIPGAQAPNDGVPREVSLAQSNLYSLQAFFYEYSIIPGHSSLSLGYLSGLEDLAVSLGPSSDVVRACQAVACASLGKQMNRPYFAQRAEIYHQALLGSLAKTIQDPLQARSDETMRLAMLLGLFQIIMANKTEPRTHDIHAKGLAALTDMDNSPLYLLRTLRQRSPKTTQYTTIRHGSFQGTTTTEKPQIAALLSVPSTSSPNESLDELLVSLNDLWERSNICSSLHDYLLLKDQCLAMDQRLAQWQASRLPEFRSTPIASVSRTQQQDKVEVGHWPGNVDTYFDLYVAHVWNVFRTARLLLIAIMHRVWQACEESADVYKLSAVAISIADDMISSIPFHLVESLPAFIKDLSTSAQITQPGRAIGGLLLMHPLHIASNLPFLPEPTKQYMRDCLSWIGSHMGIGHANLLAQAQKIDRDSLMSAIVIVWSGFLG